MCGFRMPCICPILFCKTGLGCSKARTASASARTTSEGAPYETRSVHVRVHATLSKKSQEHTENRENACDNYIAGGYRLSTDHRLVWLPESYGHATLALDILCRGHMKLSDSLPSGPNLFPWETARHALRVRKTFRRILNCAGAVYPAVED